MTLLLALLPLLVLLLHPLGRLLIPGPALLPA
jgi:hypothetical protein